MQALAQAEEAELPAKGTFGCSSTFFSTGLDVEGGGVLTGEGDAVDDEADDIRRRLAGCFAALPPLDMFLALDLDLNLTFVGGGLPFAPDDELCRVERPVKH